MSVACEGYPPPRPLSAGRPAACLEKPYTALTVDDVYDIAKLIGSEVERLIDAFGSESAGGLVPKIVKVLELLERFAARNRLNSCPEEELLRAVETLQVQRQQRKQRDPDSRGEIKELQLKEQKWRSKAEELQAQVSQLSEDNQQLLTQLRSSLSQEDRAQREEREVMLRLKEVVDRQRDEIRAKAQEIASVSKEVEALQEQLERFMKMNGELRHKQSMAQAQLKSTMERRTDLETDLHEKQKEIERLRAQLEETARSAGESLPGTVQTQIDLTDKMIIDLKDPNRPFFTKQEVREMLFERNELKANLFLVQEELTYYQREILNEERCPGFLLDAVKSAIKKQRKVIKAKMLGIPEEDCSSDEEGRESLYGGGSAGTDCTDSGAPESRIRNVFGFLSRSSSAKSPSQPSTSTSWEILVPEETESSEEPGPPDLSRDSGSH